MLLKIASFMLAFAALATFAVAQEGHPLTGSWHGEWTAGGQSNHVVMFLRWENRKITGTINPGRAGLPITAASLNADNWTVKIESDTKDGQHIMIEGKLDDIGSYNRTITGTWTQGTTKAPFKMTRD